MLTQSNRLLSRQADSRADIPDEEVDADDRLEPQPPTVHTVSVSGYFGSLKRHRKGQFWSPNKVELSGIPAWREHIKQLTVPARRRKCQGFLKAILRCFNHMAIWCDNGSGISLTSEQEKQELTRYKRDLDLCAKVFCVAPEAPFVQIQIQSPTVASAWTIISRILFTNVVVSSTGCSQNA